MLDRLIHFFKGPNLFHPSVWKGRLRPTTFRSLTPADISQCLEIYTLNEPDRFPSDDRARYVTSLRAGDAWYLVAERDGRIVATGGIAKMAREDVVILSYGLVHPAYQGRGLGIALTLARLALLDLNQPVYHVLILAVKKSIDYYGRLGFRVIGSWKDKHGNDHPFAYLHVLPRDILRCRRLLASHGIHWPDSGVKIPLENGDPSQAWVSTLGFPPPCGPSRVDANAPTC